MTAINGAWSAWTEWSFNAVAIGVRTNPMDNTIPEETLDILRTRTGDRSHQRGTITYPSQLLLLLTISRSHSLSLSLSLSLPLLWNHFQSATIILLMSILSLLPSVQEEYFYLISFTRTYFYKFKVCITLSSWRYMSWNYSCGMPFVLKELQFLTTSW